MIESRPTNDKVMEITFIERLKDHILGPANHLVSNINKKISRKAVEYILQMSADQLKAPLNVACKVVDNACIFLLDDHLNLLGDVC